MVTSMYKCPLFWGSTKTYFSHPYFPSPPKNIIFSEFCPRTFFFVPIINKWMGDDLARPKRCIFDSFFRKYLAVLTGILGLSKGVRQRANHRGNARAVFNCSGVGYSAIAASAVGARGRGFSDFPVLAKINFSGFRAKYQRLLFTSLFSFPPEKPHFGRVWSQNFLLCIDNK